MASFLVGTFNTPELFHFYFDAVTHSLNLVEVFPALGNHSWLALDEKKKHLYATAWTEPSSIASYAIQQKRETRICCGNKEESLSLKLLNTAPTRSRSGYVAVGKNPSNVVYTVGGPTGEVLRLNEGCGSFSTRSMTLQHLDFLHGRVTTLKENKCNAEAANGSKEDGGCVLDFGGLRHGSHSIDLSPDGTIAFVADIGRNCIWVYTVSPKDGTLILSQKYSSPRVNDGPRHVWPHPNGKVVYVLQEHSCMVDVFEVHRSKAPQAVLETSKLGPQSMQVTMLWKQEVRIIPTDLSPSLFWADEVRLTPGATPSHLLASTRGLEPKTKGYVALFGLQEDGFILDTTKRSSPAWLDLWQSPTSGGWANAVEPCYKTLRGKDGMESMYAALTDSEQGLVLILQIRDGKLVNVAQFELGEVLGSVRGAATAVWL